MNPAIPSPNDAGAAPFQSAHTTPSVPLTRVRKFLLPVGVVVFDWLFWLEKAGPNMLVFTAFIVAAQLAMLPRHAAVRRSGYFWLMAAGSLFAGVMVALYGSAVAALACMASVLLMLGYVNQPHLKLLLAAGNWEVWIARYNLQPRFRSLDIGFLLDMPGRALPALVAHRSLLAQIPQLTAEDEYGNAISIPAAEAQARLTAAVAHWNARYAAHPDWQGRTVADWQTHQLLNGPK